MVNANIFDLNLEEETFEKLSLDELKQRKVVSQPHNSHVEKATGLNYFDSLRAPPLPSKTIKGSTMESRFRISSISETEEILKLRHDQTTNGADAELENIGCGAKKDFKHSKFINHPSAILAQDIINEEEGDNNDPDIKIVTGGYQIGKTPDSCEDAYFITDRGFGVADGVSGWNDYGFSSSLFATQIMQNCKDEIESYLLEERNRGI